MGNKVCFMFGHATTPYDAISLIEAAAEKQYNEQGIRTFIVGNRGNFDSYAATAIKRLKQKHDDITLLLLLAYHPAERPVHLTEGFDNSYYPPIENVPRQYAIVRANKYMVDTADSIICYVNRIGNTRKLLQQAERRQKKENILIENVATVL
jgi:uncharacterized phage-like protein YoqJ